ncbi:hypothetical protein [Candidatus Rariloculus sp.]|uniref:hypothetical protein n=1 Tax=Candidatus Rariloculus sp. TaxID=3101265 RepID=UPI003D0D2748
MKKPIGLLTTGVAIALAGGYAFVNDLAAQPGGLGDIFVSEDNDSFDPGLPVGAPFPAIRALYQGQEITSVDDFMGDRGLAFFAMRSVDW